MPSLALEDRLIWFAHCPKAGGTSIEQTMVAQWGDRVGHLRWSWDRWWTRGGWRTADPPNSPQHLIWHDALKALPRAPDKVFALVRDPASRMVSEYRYQRHHRRGRRLGRLVASLPFPIWLRLMLAVARRNPYAFDNHLRPQTDFVPETAVVFRLEGGLEAPLAWLAETTGTAVPATSPHLLKGGTNPVRVSAGLAARIAAAYGADYTRFGYPIPAGIPPDDTLWDRATDTLARGLVWLERRGQI